MLVKARSRQFVQMHAHRSSSVLLLPDQISSAACGKQGVLTANRYLCAISVRFHPQFSFPADGHFDAEEKKLLDAARREVLAMQDRRIDRFYERLQAATEAKEAEEVAAFLKAKAMGIGIRTPRPRQLTKEEEVARVLHETFRTAEMRETRSKPEMNSLISNSLTNNEHLMAYLQVKKSREKYRS